MMAEHILDKIVRHKTEEVERARQAMPLERLIEAADRRDGRRPFFERLSRPGPAGVNIIAEIKRGSPSKGTIRAGLDPADYARRYAAAGAAALSVLTDAAFFQGSFDDFHRARAAANLPMLRKDFVISEYQIYESAVLGADAVLLIVRILSPAQLSDFLAQCETLQLDTLVEVHSEAELQVALEAGAPLVGINNRDLDTFRTDIATCMRLAERLAPGRIAVAESGIHARADIERIQAAGIFNFLIGESLVRAENTERFLQQLLGIETGA
ncbi:MAG TPA: indole-3-glycerol phosphate synthase TrpC [Desulfobacterales bacterium]